MTDLATRAADTAQIFTAWCERHRYTVTPDGRVNPQVAAELLGMSEGHLRNMRSAFSGPVFMKAAGRISYRLHDLANWIEASRRETLDCALSALKEFT